VDPEGRRRAAQVVAAAVVLVAAAGGARAQLARDSTAPVREVYASCSGDGLPPPPRGHARGRLPWSLQPSALVQAWGAAWAGRDVRQTDLDAVDGAALYLGVARLGVCGMLGTPAGPLSWNVVYQPYSLDDAAHFDHQAWGSFAAAEIGFAPWRWLTLSVGIRKIAFSYGHDEPLELRALPIIPYVAQSIAPDRRAGITLDDDFGAAHIVVGVYQGARNLDINAQGGMLVTARLVAEPIGPVGNTVSTLGDPEYWRQRVRFAVNASFLYQYVEGTSHYAIGGDGALHWGPLGVAGEYLFSSRTAVEAPALARQALSPMRQGLWLEAAVMLWRPWIEVAARYDWMDSSLQPGQQFNAVTAGLSGFGGRLLKLQLLYTHKFHYGIPPGRPEIADDLFLIVGQLALQRTFP